MWSAWDHFHDYLVMINIWTTDKCKKPFSWIREKYGNLLMRTLLSRQIRNVRNIGKCEESFSEKHVIWQLRYVRNLWIGQMKTVGNFFVKILWVWQMSSVRTSCELGKWSLCENWMTRSTSLKLSSTFFENLLPVLG